MAKKKTDTTSTSEITPTPKKSGFKANLAKRTGITLVPVTELIENDKTTYTDTGSYTLNALVCGSIYGGIPSDTIVGLAGEKATGKTYVCISICKQFLEKHPNGEVFYFDTEAAIKPFMVMERGLPEDRFNLKKVNTLEQFRMEAVRIVDDYMTYPEDERPPILMVLDSLGNISTMKEIMEAGKDLDKQAKDMTKAQLIRSVFRVLSIKLAEANVPLLVTNHVGVKIGGHTRPGQPPAVEMSGGEGLKYAASTIIILTKSKLYNKLTASYDGVKMTAALYKSRTTIENMKAQTQLYYATGMDRYFGLFELAKKFGLVEKSGTGFKFSVGENQKQFFTKDIEGDPEKGIRGNPEQYFTKEVLDALEERVINGFRYGKGIPMAIAMEDDGVTFDIDKEESSTEE